MEDKQWHFLDSDMPAVTHKVWYRNIQTSNCLNLGNIYVFSNYRHHYKTPHLA